MENLIGYNPQDGKRVEESFDKMAGNVIGGFLLAITYCIAFMALISWYPKCVAFTIMGLLELQFVIGIISAFAGGSTGGGIFLLLFFAAYNAILYFFWA